MNMNIIALDGPAGSGKSTVAREIAKIIGFKYFDSGAYYRALTYAFMQLYAGKQASLPFDEWLALEKPEALLSGLELDCIFTEEGENRILLNREDVSHEIRTPDVTEKIRYIANKPAFREFVNTRIRKLVNENRLVMDGRDIGTEVFPDAIYKFFLTASIEVRAERRHNDLRERGIETDLENLKKEIETRDRTDTERDIAPLKQANDAILIDTSHMAKNIVIENILSRIQRNSL